MEFSVPSKKLDEILSLVRNLMDSLLLVMNLM